MAPIGTHFPPLWHNITQKTWKVEEEIEGSWWKCFLRQRMNGMGMATWNPWGYKPTPVHFPPKKSESHKTSRRQNKTLPQWLQSKPLLYQCLLIPIANDWLSLRSYHSRLECWDTPECYLHRCFLFTCMLTTAYKKTPWKHGIIPGAVLTSRYILLNKIQLVTACQPCYISLAL